MSKHLQIDSDFRKNYNKNMEIFIFLFVYYVEGYISKDSSKIMIEYYLRKGLDKVELIYNYKGKDYLVGFHKNIYLERGNFYKKLCNIFYYMLSFWYSSS